MESLESIDEEGREGISVKGNKNGPILSEKTFCTSRRKEDDINTGVLLYYKFAEDSGCLSLHPGPSLAGGVRGGVRHPP